MTAVGDAALVVLSSMELGRLTEKYPRLPKRLFRYVSQRVRNQPEQSRVLGGTSPLELATLITLLCIFVLIPP